MTHCYHRTERGSVMCSRNSCAQPGLWHVDYPNLTPGDLCCWEHAQWRKRALPGVRISPAKEEL